MGGGGGGAPPPPTPYAFKYYRTDIPFVYLPFDKWFPYFMPSITIQIILLPTKGLRFSHSGISN